MTVLSSAASATSWAVNKTASRNEMLHLDSASCCLLRLLPVDTKNAILPLPRTERPGAEPSGGDVWYAPNNYLRQQ